MTTLADLARVERELRDQAQWNSDLRLKRISRDKTQWADTIAAYIAAQGWRSIETAPRCDCCPESEAWVKSCLLGRFDSHGWIAWVGQMDSGMWLEGNSRRSFGDSEMPTHWMPLPEPPKENTNG